MRSFYLCLITCIVLTGCLFENSTVARGDNGSDLGDRSSSENGSVESAESSTPKVASSENNSSARVSSESTSSNQVSSSSSKEIEPPPTGDESSSATQSGGDQVDATRPGWTLFWSEEFNGTKLNESDWNYEEGGDGWGNNEAQFYTRDNITLSGGVLVIEAKRERKGSNNYTSARITTQGKRSFKYGRIEAKIKMPQGLGTWPAFWLLGDNITSVGWPQCGEIDVMEAKGRLPKNSSSALHMGQAWDLKDTQWDEIERPMDLSADFHIYAIEWSETQIKFFSDDENFYTTSAGTNCSDRIWCPFGEAADWDFYLLLNLAIGGHFDNYAEPPASWEGTTMEVDWVRVYNKD